VGNNTQPSCRVSLPFRQVVVPSWLHVILLVAYACSFVSLLADNPRLLLIAVVANVVLVVTMWRKRTTEAKAASTGKATAGTLWRRLRTYQLWQLVLLVVVSAGVLLEAAGVVTLP
jgi:hypothetical protein